MKKLLAIIVAAVAFLTYGSAALADTYPAAATFLQSGVVEGNYGDYRNARMADGSDLVIKVNGFFSAVPTSVKMYFLPSGTGNAAWYTTTAFGAPTEAWNANTDSQGSSGSPQTTAMTSGNVEVVDITNSFTNAAAGDSFGLTFHRAADNSADTLSAALDFIALEVEYPSGGSLPANADGYLRNNGSGTLSWDNASTVKSFLSLNNVENTALSTWAGTTNLTTLGTITTGTWTGTTLAVNKGGTGQTSYTDGQVLIGNTSSGGLDKTTLTAGTNVTVTNGNGSISIASSGGGSSLPADAAGWLENDGAGTLSWSNPPGTGGSMETTCATGGDYTSAVWEPCQPFGGLDVVAMLGVLLCVVIFFAVGLWPQKR